MKSFSLFQATLSGNILITEKHRVASSSHFWYEAPDADLYPREPFEKEKIDAFLDDREHLKSLPVNGMDNDKIGEKYEYFADDNYTGRPSDEKNPAFYYEGSGESEVDDSEIW